MSLLDRALTKDHLWKPHLKNYYLNTARFENAISKNAIIPFEITVQIYRHPKKDCRPSKLDCIWTFGSKDNKTGYMLYGGVRVHQIVATAFHGTPDDPHMVIDHKNTNRCNNRPENLAWVTRLENAPNNPITRIKSNIYMVQSRLF